MKKKIVNNKKKKKKPTKILRVREREGGKEQSKERN